MPPQLPPYLSLRVSTRNTDFASGAWTLFLVAHVVDSGKVSLTIEQVVRKSTGDFIQTLTPRLHQELRQSLVCVMLSFGVFLPFHHSGGAAFPNTLLVLLFPSLLLSGGPCSFLFERRWFFASAFIYVVLLSLHLWEVQRVLLH